MVKYDYDICIYHKNCLDGFTSAWVVWLALGDKCEYIPGDYGDSPPCVKDKKVIIVDFSYKKEIIIEMLEVAKSVTILDHHKTAEKDLRFLKNERALKAEYGLKGRNKKKWDHVHVIFDKTKSGAMITYGWFDAPGAVERGFIESVSLYGDKIIQHVQDYDLYKFKLEGTKEIKSWLYSFEFDFKTMSDCAFMIEHATKEVLLMGEAIARNDTKTIKALLVATRRIIKIDRYEIPAANIPFMFSSEAGHIMGENEKFAACYWDTPEGRTFSLRSSETGLDVSSIAKKYGGGGHEHAAGFKVNKYHKLYKI